MKYLSLVITTIVILAGCTQNNENAELPKGTLNEKTQKIELEDGLGHDLLRNILESGTIENIPDAENLELEDLADQIWARDDLLKLHKEKLSAINAETSRLSQQSNAAELMKEPVYAQKFDLYHRLENHLAEKLNGNRGDTLRAIRKCIENDQFITEPKAGKSICGASDIWSADVSWEGCKFKVDKPSQTFQFCYKQRDGRRVECTESTCQISEVTL